MSVHKLEAPTHAPLAPLCKPGTRDTLLDRLCEVAHAVPDAVAVHTEDGAVTFDELLHRTYASARKIAQLAGDDPRPIAVEAASTSESIATMLAVMASGHALVPLDSNLPANRADRIVESAAALRLDQADLANTQDSAMPLPTLTGSRTALIAYTSGSTGAAKGVLLSHRMCLTKAYEVSSALGLSSRDRVGNALPVSFGAGLNTLFAGILSGATVYCTDPRTVLPTTLTEWIERSSLTTLHCSPSLVRSFRAGAEEIPSDAIVPVPDNAVPSLRVVTTYGEALHSRDVIGFRSALGSGATFVNWYATTEAGGVAYGEYRSDRPLPSGFLTATTLPKGKIVDVVDQAGTLAPAGVAGEIRVSAECLSDGYLGLPDLTESHFASDGPLMRYATGDLGRFDELGQLHLLGRADDAVKIRGYLVEPAEVEAAIRGVDGVRDVAIVARSIDGEPHLDAFFVSDTRDSAYVRAGIQDQLPTWMVPRNITRTLTIERNERGKVDRQRLPEQVADVASATASDAPRGATEMWIANIVHDALRDEVDGIDDIGSHTDFTAMGATSLALTQISVGVARAFHIVLSAEELVGAMSVRRLASIVDTKLASIDDNSARSRAESIAVPLRTTGSLTPLFIVAGGGVPAVGLAALARRLDPNRPVYVIQAKGMDTRALPDRTIRAAARTYVREITRIQPSGPYLLAGHSLGGWIALEMAHQLRAGGRSVARLTLLDPRLYRHLLDRLPGGSALEAAPAGVGAASSPKITVATRVGIAARVATAGIARYSTTERWLAFAAIGSLALRFHRPKAWNGPVSVIVTAENTDDRRSWAAIATGELSITHVDGRHVDMVREPVAEDVARILDHELRRATEGIIH
ncbi:alpha/beta fold hydrolase [Rhodococcus sp. NPDC057297]|uniref:alpha/beta fold hydrolase n=1 Tax=Rhodococcus sp. NPDC057297 TaxID=3346090 RepID=UPI0036392B67